jgi:nesprin-1
MLSFHGFLPQNDLKVLFTSLADSKYIILQKLANVFEQPIVEQMQVCTGMF